MVADRYSLDNDSQMGHWDEFVSNHPKGTPYHLSGWLRVIQRTYAFVPHLFVWQWGGAISGVLPLFSVHGLIGGRRLVSLPFSDYGGPLFLDEKVEAHALEETIADCKRQEKSIEIRGPVPGELGFIPLNYYKSHVLPLSGSFADITNKIDRRTILYSVRKAEKAGLEIREANDAGGMEHFYRLNSLTRRKHGVPAQSKEFFANVLEHVIGRGLGFLLLSHHLTQAVGGSLFLRAGRSLHYKYNASDPDCLGKMTPNHALTYHAIRKGNDEGYVSLDFGRSSPDNAGLMRYKSMWGCECIDCPYSYFPRVRGASSTEENSGIFRAFTGLWRRLPVSVTQALGPRIYRHMV
jgi:hypothetical protein